MINVIMNRSIPNQLETVIVVIITFFLFTIIQALKNCIVSVIIA